MENNINITYDKNFNEDGLKNHSLNSMSPGNLGLETNLRISIKDDIFEIPIIIIEFYTQIKEWLNNEYLEPYTLKSSEEILYPFSIDSEDGEDWFFITTYKDIDYQIPVDIDELILELWKFTIELEVDISKQYKYDLINNKEL